MNPFLWLPAVPYPPECEEVVELVEAIAEPETTNHTTELLAIVCISGCVDSALSCIMRWWCIEGKFHVWLPNVTCEVRLVVIVTCLVEMLIFSGCWMMSVSALTMALALPCLTTMPFLSSVMASRLPWRASETMAMQPLRLASIIVLLPAPLLPRITFLSLLNELLALSMPLKLCMTSSIIILPFVQMQLLLNRHSVYFVFQIGYIYSELFIFPLFPFIAIFQVSTLDNVKIVEQIEKV